MDTKLVLQFREMLHDSHIISYFYSSMLRDTRENTEIYLTGLFVTEHKFIFCRDEKLKLSQLDKNILDGTLSGMIDNIRECLYIAYVDDDIFLPDKDREDVSIGIDEMCGYPLLKLLRQYIAS